MRAASLAGVQEEIRLTKGKIVLENNLEIRYAKYRGILKNLTIMSDIFMRNVLKEKICTEYVLQVILQKKDLKITDQIIQKDYKNLQGRSAILDCVARDLEGKQFNIEIQQDKEGATPKRARYHSALIDMNILNPGQEFKELPESYVIFITREDVLGHGFTIYHVNRNIEETGQIFEDEAHIIYVNSAVQEDTELGNLIHDLHCKNADEMYSEILASRVRQLKETEKGVDFMCQEMDRIYEEGTEYGIEIGERRKAQETVFSLAEMGFSIEQITQAVKINRKIVEDWLEEAVSTVK